MQIDDNDRRQPMLDHAEPDEADGTSVGLQEARIKRVKDYQLAALKKEDHLAANLASINAGLMRIALAFDGAIDRALAGGSPSVERIQKVLPAIETHLRLTRQIDRFGQLELRAASPRSPAVEKALVGAIAANSPSPSEETAE